MSLRRLETKQNLNAYPIQISDQLTKQAGFSLIEVMVSAFLISIGMMGMITLQTRSVNYSTIAYTETQSTFLLQEIVEQLRANKSAALNGDYNITLSSIEELPSSKGSLAEVDRLTWFTNLNNTLHQAKASINCDSISTCSVEIQHSISNSTKNLSLAVIL